MSAARRFARTLRLLFGPTLWLFALIGAAWAAFPGRSSALTAYPVPHSGLAARPVRPAGALEVGVWKGSALADPSTGVAPPAAAWHPRVLLVEAAGDTLLDRWQNVVSAFRMRQKFGLFTGEGGEAVDEEEALEQAIEQLRTTPRYEPDVVTLWPRLGMIAARTKSRPDSNLGPDEWIAKLTAPEPAPTPFEGDTGASCILRPPHRVDRVGVSLWPLLALAGLVGVARWWFAPRRDEPDGVPAPRRRAARRLAAWGRTVRRAFRPWVWLAAAAGLMGVAALFLPTGPVTWFAGVVRGPVQDPHPRLFEASTSWDGAGNGARPPGRAWSWAAPAAGLWAERSSEAPSRNRRGTRERARFAVSLWWFLAAGLLANAATLVRLFRARPAT